MKYKRIIARLDINEESFHQTCNKFRSPHIWRKIKGKWKLRHTVNQNGTDD